MLSKWPVNEEIIQVPMIVGLSRKEIVEARLREIESLGDFKTFIAFPLVKAIDGKIYEGRWVESAASVVKYPWNRCST